MEVGFANCMGSKTSIGVVGDSSFSLDGSIDMFWIDVGRNLGGGASFAGVVESKGRFGDMLACGE
jgi:hypothetical protein